MGDNHDTGSEEIEAYKPSPIIATSAFLWIVCIPYLSCLKYISYVKNILYDLYDIMILKVIYP